MSSPLNPIDEHNIWFLEESTGDGDDLPVRIMNNFKIIDVSKRGGGALICLSSLTNQDQPDSSCVAIGEVEPDFNEDAVEEEEEDDDGDDQPHREWIRTSSIFVATFDLEDPEGVVWIRTEFSWYKLLSPSKAYSHIYHPFLRLRGIARSIVASAQAEAYPDYARFVETFVKNSSSLGDLTPKALRKELSDALQYVFEEGVDDSFLSLPLVQSLKTRLHHKYIVHAKPDGISKRSKVPLRDWDSKVISRPELQQTRTTPTIYHLAKKYFPNRLLVVDLVQPDDRPMDPKTAGHRNEEKTWKLLQRVMNREFIQRNFDPGDVVLTRQDISHQNFPDSRMKLPKGARIHDYFCLWKVTSINSENSTVHAQLLHHASDTLVAEVHNPVELFYSTQCKDIKMKHLIGTVKVNFATTETSSLLLGDEYEYFCRATYSSTPTISYALDSGRRFPLCAICNITSASNNVASFELGRSTEVCHIFDFILYKDIDEDENHQSNETRNSLCQIGQITRMRSGPSSARTMSVRRLGRVDPLRSIDGKRNERHVFLTDDVVKISVNQILRKCGVFFEQDLPLRMRSHPDIFFLTQFFPSWPSQALYQSTSTDKAILSEKLTQCNHCELLWTELQYQFDQELTPLSTFDIFSGVGAFSAGMAETGILQVTHAVEIAPSAAMTLKQNSPETIVHNVCANLLLERAVEVSRSCLPKLTHDLRGKPLPPPPLPGKIDVIIAGCPCQPHSGLNRFASTHDKKAELFLCLLSWVDFLKPKYVYFENVAAFATTDLPFDDKDSDEPIKGGILRLFTHALLTLGYQTHLQVLQAGNHGTPQSRKRLFLIASRGSIPLPNFPPPRYAFPRQESQRIFDGEQREIYLLRAVRGIASHPPVTIEDAIGDLWPWDWSCDGSFTAESRWPQEYCDPNDDYYGPPLVDSWYYHEPRNNFQAECRLEQPGRRLADGTQHRLQHYTMRYPQRTVIRVLEVEMHPGADFSSFPPQHLSHGMAHQQSATARTGFRTGSHYDRLDKDRFFNTIVTNISPDAKQSRVLHPYCRRTLTVREWARGQGFPDSFTFHTIQEAEGRLNVKQIHRQIGNAVAWPVARALGWELRQSLFDRWLIEQRQNSMYID